MPTPSGQIGLSDVNVELSKSATALITLNDSDVRTLAQKTGSGTIISMDDLRGKSATFTCSVSSNVATLSGGQTATITFVTTSETYDFDSADVSISAGSISALSTSNYKNFTATYTPPTNSTGTVNIFVPANTFMNASQTVFNTVSNTVQITYDTLQPTMSITAGSTNLGIGQTTVITFTSSESTTNFALADVTNTSGTLSNFSGSGTTYTATYTPPVNSSGSTNISVASNSFSDSFGNINPASNTLTISYNTLPAPTYAISPNVSSVNEGGTVTYTVTTTNFGSGTLYWTHVTGTALVGAADMTDGVDNGSVSISGNSGSFTRTLSNDLSTEGTETLRVQLRTGSTAGTVVATASDVSIGDTSTTPVIDISPATIPNGTTGTSYSQNFFAQVNGTNTPAAFYYIGDIPPGMNFTQFGNTGGGFYIGATLSGTANISNGFGTYVFTVYAQTNNGYYPNRTYVITMYGPPNMTISTNNANLGPGQTAALTFQTDTGAYNFDQSDITIISGGGTISGFSGGNGSTSFTATYTPPANTNGTAYIYVPAQTWQNNLGGNSAESNTLAISYNTQVPTVYNPLEISGTQWNSQQSGGAQSVCGVVFYRDGTYKIYQDGFTNTYYWTTQANANSGVGKYVRFTFNAGNSYISPSGGYGASPNGFNTWMEMSYNFAQPITAGTPYVFVVETNQNSYSVYSYINVTIQISSSASGSPILSTSSVTFLAEAWYDTGGGGGA